MKRRILVPSLFFLAGFAFAQNPLLGSWQMETIGSPDPVEISFAEDGTYLFVDGQNESTHGYVYLESQGQLDLEVPDFGWLRLRLELVEDAYFLYTLAEDENPFVAGLSAQFESMRSINLVTDMFVDQLEIAFANALASTPIFHLTPVAD